MSDYTKVLDGLHHCINLGGLEPNDTRIRCHGCPYFTEPTRCGGILMQDAAAAIEELQAEIRESMQKCAECSKWNEPKRGKWITIRLNNGGSYTGCSCCEAPIPTDTMLDYIPESESKYCYSCGAKMEVQDESVF